MAMQSILLLAALAYPNAPQQGPGEVAPDSTEARAGRIEVRGPNGEWVNLGDPLQTAAFALPLTSLSERVHRPHPDPPGAGSTGESDLAVMISSPADQSIRLEPRLKIFGHGPNEVLVLVRDQPWALGQMTPPALISGPKGVDAGLFARRDGRGHDLADGVVTVRRPEGNADPLIVFGAGPSTGTVVVNGIPMPLMPGPTTPLVVWGSGDETTMTLSVIADDPLVVDAIQFAPVRPLRTAADRVDRTMFDSGHSVGLFPDDGLQPIAVAEADRAGARPRAAAPGSETRPAPTGRLALDNGLTADRERQSAEPGRVLLQSDLRPGRARSFWFSYSLSQRADPSEEEPETEDGEPEAWTLVLEPHAQRFGPPHEPPVRFDPAESSAPTVSSLTNVTDEVGLGLYLHLEGPPEQLDIRPTMGPGAAWGDVNGDGYLDLFVPQGGGREGVAPLPDRLYLGSEDGSFADASATSGLASGDAGMGALFVDVNGDDHLDLYCANYGLDRLFLGKGDGTFTDATELLPGHDLWSASVTAADPDGDGDLDLYITSYLDYDPAKMPPADELGRYQREDPVEMLPFAFPGQRNVYLRNQLTETGKLGFQDVTEELGLLDVQGRGMQTVFWDFDRDGDEDLYVANDVSFNVLFRNEGDGTFKDVSFSTGLDDPRGGMGLAVGDIDLDGDDDVFLTNWQLEANALYLNSIVSRSNVKRRRSSFHDGTVKSGFGPSGIGKTSWGAEFFDLELDGDLDLYVANGYTSPDYESTGICVGQTDQLFLGDGRGKLSEAVHLAPAAMSLDYASRGAIGADYDRDGDVDLLVTANNGPVTLLRNDAKRAGTWLGVRLRQPGGNRHAIGARVTVRAEGSRPRSQSLRAGTGYLTGNAPELHFGLGAIEGPVHVQVTWPDGSATEHPGVTPGEWVTLAR